MIDRNLGSETPKPRAFDAMVWGGLLAGTLDAVDGVVALGLKGMNPIQVLQYIASGLFGIASFQGGLKTAGLGALLHYLIAFAVAAVYYAASVKLPALHAHPAKWGLTYGVAVVPGHELRRFATFSCSKGPVFSRFISEWRHWARNSRRFRNRLVRTPVGEMNAEND